MVQVPFIQLAFFVLNSSTGISGDRTLDIRITMCMALVDHVFSFLGIQILSVILLAFVFLLI